MNFDLLPNTVAGKQFTELAERHAVLFAARAEALDDAGAFAHQNIEDLTRSGFLAATVPSKFGGMGLTSLFDQMVGISRLARGDASTAIAANMHLSGVRQIGMALSNSEVLANSDAGRLLEDYLRRVASGDMIMCFPSSEQGTDLTSPMSEATPVEGGFRLNGSKIFGSMSSAANLFFVSVRLKKEDGSYVTSTAVLPRDTAGLTITENWDGMGMRASGSNEVSFDNCFIPELMLMGRRDGYGRMSPHLSTAVLGIDMPLTAAFLGIAEAAYAFAVEHATKQKKGPSQRLLGSRFPIQHLIAEMDIKLTTCRALLEQTGLLVERELAVGSGAENYPDQIELLMKQFQCMKYVINRNVIEIVDTAMIICGGGAYRRRHLLSRLYRDSRAGPFMQPFAPYEAFEYIGKVALGLVSDIDR